MTYYYIVLFIWLLSILLAPVLFVAGWKFRKKEYYAYSHIAFLLAGIYVYARFVEPNLLFINDRYLDLSSGKQQDRRHIKAALFADTHIGLYRDKSYLARVVKKINAARPDIVLMPGDFIFGTRFEDIRKNLAGLKDLEAPAFAVLGNHDDGGAAFSATEEVKAALKECGVTVMDDRLMRVTSNGHDIVIAGLSDYLAGNPDYGILKNLSDNDFNLVLSHNPDSVYSFNGADADLVLSGHTHAGQVRLPFIYKHVIPSEHGFDKGLYDIDGTKVFITSGLGMVGLPLRFLDPPAIDIIEMDF